MWYHVRSLIEESLWQKKRNGQDLTPAEKRQQRYDWWLNPGGAPVDQGNPGNLRAMMEAAREYGNY
jgi:hypothetical protein